ncbi:hypothetical protein O181_079850 [Austropuccinia psidii MF-1]|uniref:Uncharacterized protein n=1 Tax=Austropuccinia psidii MF-1 TaxID=1389203 RepID=A0A9Q3FFR9_9BASI|nr:hypothetical protein [Austropuccinia psidii MF-1]
MQTDDSGDHYNQRKTHHQNFPGSSGKRDNSESSAPQPRKHGSSSSCYPLNNLADAFVQDSHHHEQQEQQRRAQRASKQLSKKELLGSLKGQLPDNVHSMRSAVHQNFWFLLKVPNKDLRKLSTPQQQRSSNWQ